MQCAAECGRAKLPTQTINSDGEGEFQLESNARRAVCSGFCRSGNSPEAHVTLRSRPAVVHRAIRPCSCRGPAPDALRTGPAPAASRPFELRRRAEMRPQAMPQDMESPRRGLEPRARRAARPARPGRLPELDRSAGLRRRRPGRRAPRCPDELHRHLGVAQLWRHDPPAALQGRRRRSAGSSSAWRPPAAGDPRRAAGRGARRPAAPALPAGPDVDLPASPLDGRCTFDNFVVGKPNELAHAAARRVADGGPVTFNPLFLYGGVGLGKTHLMHAIAWEVQQNNPEARVLYLSAEQFMYRFVSALRFKEMHGFKEMFRSVDMLMVDDVQFISGKDFDPGGVLPHLQRADRAAEADRDLRRPGAGRDRRARGADPLAAAVGAGRRPAPDRLRAPPRHPAGQGRGAARAEPGRRHRRRG